MATGDIGIAGVREVDVGESEIHSSGPAAYTPFLVRFPAAFAVREPNISAKLGWLDFTTSFADLTKRETMAFEGGAAAGTG